MPAFISKWFVNFTRRFPVWIVIGSLLVTGVSVYFSTHLVFKSDFSELLPEDYPSLEDLNAIRQKAGGIGYFVVVLQSDDVEQTKKFADVLAPELEKAEDIRFVDYKIPRAFFDDRALLFLSQEDLGKVRERLAKKIKAERKKINPFYFDLTEEKTSLDLADITEKYGTLNLREYYVTKDNSVVLLIKPKGLSTDLPFCRRLLAQVDKKVAELKPQSFHSSMSVQYTGRYYIRINENDVMLRDLQWASVLAFIAVVFLILYASRKLRAILIIGLPLAESLAWTFGLTYFAIGEINAITGFLIAMLAGNGIEFGIHILSRYLEERKNGLPMEQCLSMIYRKTTRSLFTTSATTVVAFASLMLTDFKGFNQFGFIAAVGIIFAFLATAIVGPSLIVLTERISPLIPPLSLVKLREKKMGRYPYSVPVLGLCAGLILGSVFLLPRLEFDYDFRKLAADKQGSLELQEKISRDFGISLSPSVVYAKDFTGIKTITRLIKEVQKEQNGEKSTIKATLSLFSFFPEDQEGKLGEIGKIGALLEDRALHLGGENKDIDRLRELANVQPFSKEEIPFQVSRQYFPLDGANGSFVFIYPKVDLWDGKQVIRYANEIRGIKEKAAAEKVYMLASGEALIFSDVLNLIKRDGPKALGVAILCVFFLLFIDSRSWRSALLVMTPIISAILLMSGIMALFGIKLNFINAVVFPTLIAVGIDSSVHIFHRYHDEGIGSLPYVLNETGHAVFFATVANMVGFASFFVAYHKGLRSVGTLAVIGLSSCLFFYFTLLPAILQVLEKRAKLASVDDELVKKKMWPADEKKEVSLSG